MISKLIRAAALVPVVVLCACGGGDSPSAPAGFSVEAGDARVKVTWTAYSGLDYYLWWKKGAGVVVRDSTALSMLHRISSPTIISSWATYNPSGTFYLENGSEYSFVMNATYSGGESGPSTASLTATPQLAGDTWTQAKTGSVTGAIPSSVSVNGATFNSAASTPLFVAVGSGGAVYTSTDASTWTNTATLGADLNAAASVYDSTNVVSTYIAVGASGVLRTSSDATTWSTPATLPSVSGALRDVIYGSSLYVAVGDGGAILTSTDPTVTWTGRTSGTTNALYAVSYVNSTYVAVGAGGTILTSSDGLTWTARTSGTSNDLRDVTYGEDVSGVYYYVAVGANGTVLTSTDLVTWTSRSSGTTSDLYSITKGSRFMAVGAGGKVIYSVAPTSSWTSVSATTTALNKVIYVEPVLLTAYLAVGAAGTNLSAQ